MYDRMVRKIKIEVTAGDIERGVPCHAYRCPVGRALARMFKHSVCVGEIDHRLTWRRVGVTKDHPLPPAVARFVHRFDLGKKVRPFTFEVTLP